VRVILLVTDLGLGGTPLRMARLAEALDGTGVQVHVGCLAGPGPVSDRLQAAGIPTFACYASSPRDLSALVGLWRHVRRIRPHLIHSTLMHANLAARLVGTSLGVPVIGSTATIELERPWHRALERATAWIDRAHIVNSQAVAEYVIRVFGLPRRRVWVVPPMPAAWPRVDRTTARAALGISDRDFVVAWVGRLDPVKRLDRLVRCAEILSHIPIRFLLAGDGPDRARVERLLSASSAGHRVCLLGWREDVGVILSAADAFAFPSLTEGMPNAVLEAMAFGLPVVASDIPVLRELSGPDRRLWLVTEVWQSGGRADPAAGLADALRYLYENPRTARELGERAASWARAQGPQAAVQAVLAAYRSVLATG